MNAIVIQKARVYSAMSDVEQFEYQLRTWTDMKIEEEKLDQKDASELFSVDGALTLSGENPEDNFRQMVIGIAQQNALPLWPGLVAIVIGIAGLGSVFIGKQDRAEVRDDS